MKKCKKMLILGGILIVASVVSAQERINQEALKNHLIKLVAIGSRYQREEVVKMLAKMGAVGYQKSRQMARK